VDDPLRANYVDRLLADADGAVATIWITGLLTTDAPPTIDTLRRAFASLVAETPRLSVRWDSPARRWLPNSRSDRDLFDAVRERPPATLAEATAALIAEPIDLAREIPVRVTTVPLTDGTSPRTLLAIQLHHSLGDGRSLLFLSRRFWEWCAGQGVHWGTFVECFVVSRVATRAMLRDHLRPDLAADRRANTMVVTYVGTVDRYFTAAPFSIHTLQTHTPTWGATGFSFRDSLVINCAGFAGLWSAADLDAFVDAARAWIARHHGPGAEVIA